MATIVRWFRYGTAVEVVFQSTVMWQSDANLMHLHGHEMFELAQGLGNYNVDGCGQAQPHGSTVEEHRPRPKVRLGCGQILHSQQSRYTYMCLYKISLHVVCLVM